MWERYIHFQWHMKQKYVVLEVKLPQETFKSPAAMELVLNALIQTGGEGTPHERYWKGKTRPWASLEVAAIKGEIRFFIWCFASQKTFLVANIYAQYPDVAVHEVEDYTKSVCADFEKWDIWACQYKFIKPDPYPIKTYVDYGLSDDPDEELKVDPFASLMEVLGTVNEKTQVWFQFIARAHTAEKNLFNHRLPDRWILDAKAEIQKIIDSASIERDGQLVPSQAKMTEEKKRIIDALTRSIAKYGLDSGVRCIQMYPKGDRSYIRADLIKGAFRAFGSTELNSLAPNDIDFNYYWQDPMAYFNLPWGPRSKWLGEWLFKCYCLRSYFFYPFNIGAHFPWPWSAKKCGEPMLVLNTEELATLYHFPGSTLKVPNLKRIPSKRSEAPANLPV
jgi:hypothetical protein